MNAKTLQPSGDSSARIFDPFCLDNRHAYDEWRGWKLNALPMVAKELWVEIADIGNPGSEEIQKLLNVCKATNMAFYRTDPAHKASKEAIRNLTLRLGMINLDSNLCADHDSISSIQVMEQGRQSGYIPYTSRPLNWHTDGYYNSPHKPIRSFLMHCIRAAQEGGENRLLDTDIIYILLRDENPEYIRALMHSKAMTIPANIENGLQLRPDQSGPVYYHQPDTNTLGMRYTARTRNIIWRDNAHTRAAVEFMRQILEKDNPYRVSLRLNPGEGIVCNNILHSRTAFSDSPNSDSPRLLYRARSYDRIADTSLPTLNSMDTTRYHHALAK